ncbi:hypothetical protein NMYAN_270010 [Nitrosomonas nitrosa]|uniref:Uncharacterized protein n=1 Tax=Nitrosomonas nitrosa TaxID=52442 RepID=A0A8H9DBM8_9PROT|nr:hypothetical protein NMYAN_270010 [Nitrosomonas nitrosa]
MDGQAAFEKNGAAIDGRKTMLPDQRRRHTHLPAMVTRAKRTTPSSATAARRSE